MASSLPQSASLAVNLHNDIPQSADNPVSNSQPLHAHVEQTLRRYFAELDGQLPCDLYQMVLREVERPLLNVVLEQTGGNQTKAAQILGLNRGTLRKKLCEHALN